MRERDRFGRLHVRIARKHRIGIFTCRFDHGLTHAVVDLADLKIGLTHGKTGTGRVKVVARTGGVLLAADFDTDFFNQMRFNVEVEVFTARIHREVRLVAHLCHLVVAAQNGRSGFARDDTLLGKHQNVRLIAVQKRLITVLDVVLNPGLNQILDNQRIGRGLNLAAVDFFGHLLLLTKNRLFVAD